MKTTSTIKVTGDARKHLDRYFLEGFQKTDRIAINRVRPMVEQYAKTNAPWRDRSGAARRGLTAHYERRGHNFSVYLSHTVPYGPYLEYSNSGRFAILRPTLRALLPKVVDEFDQAWR